MSDENPFRRRWDMKAKHCPNGHIKDGPHGCMKMLLNRGVLRPVCNIRKREKAKAALARRQAGMTKLPVGRPPQGIDTSIDINPDKIHPIYNGGYELSGHLKQALIQLVCGHVVVYERSKLSYGSGNPNYDEMLWCPTDKQWFHVHKVGSVLAEKQAMVLYPLEIAAEKACFLQNEFFRLREADRVRSEKSIPFAAGHTALRYDKTVDDRRVVASLEDLRMAGYTRK